MPAWDDDALRGRGGTWTAATVREPKVRHGRRAVRRRWALGDPLVHAYVGSAGTVGVPWPHVQQVCRVERRRAHVRRGQVVKSEVEVTYAVTSVAPEEAAAAALLRALRAHWGIEHKGHWVRDVTLDEDRCQVRTGAAPQAFAACRNLALAWLRRRGAPNGAAAMRTHSGRPHAAVELVRSGGQG